MLWAADPSFDISGLPQLISGGLNNASLSELVPIIILAAAIFTRLSGFLFLAPIIGETTTPIRIRLVLGLVLSWLILPLIISAKIELPTHFSGAFALIIQQAVIGIWMGFSLRFMIYILQIVGSVIAQAMSISQVMGEGMASEPNTTVSAVLMLGGVTLLVSLDVHVALAGIFLRSFEVYPISGHFDFNFHAYEMTGRAVKIFHLCFSLAAPFIVLNFIYNVLLGFVNRAMPQLLVSFVGMPAVTGAGLILFVISVGTILLVWLSNFQKIIGPQDLLGLP